MERKNQRLLGAAAPLCAALVAVLLTATSAHADDWRQKQWHLAFLRVDEIHKITKGKGVTVAVVDTGVDGNHPDLKGNVLKGIDVVGGGDGWKDLDGHGTAMASLIAGHGHGQGASDGILGVAPEARILPIRDGVGVPADENPVTDTIKALDRAANSDAKVINFSGKAGGTVEEVETALARDIVFVAAAGNSSGALRVIQPASYPGVVAVSGLDQGGDFTETSVEGPEVVLSAPAVRIAAGGAGKSGRYNTWTGTSSATALVSATAALIRAKYPDLSANGVINRLIKTADDKGPHGRDPKYGFGVVNPLKAITADIPDIDYNPLFGPTSTPPASVTTRAHETKGQGGSAVNMKLVLALAIPVGAVLLITVGLYLMVRVRRRAASVALDRRPSGRLPQRPD